MIRTDQCDRTTVELDPADARPRAAGDRRHTRRVLAGTPPAVVAHLRPYELGRGWRLDVPGRPGGESVAALVGMGLAPNVHTAAWRVRSVLALVQAAREAASPAAFLLLVRVRGLRVRGLPADRVETLLAACRPAPPRGAAR